MGELFNPFPRLPKNIRQIGDRDDVVKLYVEDYVNTYLKRLFPSGGQDLRVGLLLGTSETYDGIPYLFIDGALEMEEVAASGERVVFSEAAWKKAYKSIEETFPKRTVQGWFLCGSPGCILSPLNYWRQHNQYFGGKNQLMYLNSGIDGDEALYVTSEDGFYRLKGYSVYYERNQMMQDYMILRKDAHRVESGAGDRVIRDFRSRMEGRKREAVSRNGTIRTLGTLCSVLSVTVLAGGVVMFNNYQKMKEMESVLVSVLPENIRMAENGEENLVVEEVRGFVVPETMGGDRYEAPADTQQASELQGSQDGQAGSDSGEPTVGISDFTVSGGSSNDSAAGDGQEVISGGNATAETDYPVTNRKPGKTYLIGEGETLYGICFKLYDNLDYLDDIRALNQLDDADRIVAGRELILPDLSEIN